MPSTSNVEINLDYFEPWKTYLISSDDLYVENECIPSTSIKPYLPLIHSLDCTTTSTSSSSTVSNSSKYVNYFCQNRGEIEGLATMNESKSIINENHKYYNDYNSQFDSQTSSQSNLLQQRQQQQRHYHKQQQQQHQSDMIDNEDQCRNSTKLNNLPDTQIKSENKRQPIACFNCRQRRLKCDGAHPCSPCVRRGVDQTCAFAQQIRRRGPGKKKLAHLAMLGDAQAAQQLGVEPGSKDIEDKFNYPKKRKK